MTALSADQSARICWVNNKQIDTQKVIFWLTLVEMPPKLPSLKNSSLSIPFWQFLHMLKLEQI